MGVDPTLDAGASIAELFWGTQGSIGEPFIRHYFHLETIVRFGLRSNILTIFVSREQPRLLAAASDTREKPSGISCCSSEDQLLAVLVRQVAGFQNG
jgi:hypothetical protein